MTDESFGESTENKKNRKHSKLDYVYPVIKEGMHLAQSALLAAINFQDGKNLTWDERIENLAKAIGKSTFLGSLLMGVIERKREHDEIAKAKHRQEILANANSDLGVDVNLGVTPVGGLNR